MYIRVTRTHVELSRMDEVLTLIPETIAAMRRLPGCHHVHVGVDRASGEGVAISTYDTADH